MGIWHAGNTISQAISGLLAAGILTNMDYITNLRAWHCFLLLEGKWILWRMVPATSSRSFLNAAWLIQYSIPLSRHR